MHAHSPIGKYRSTNSSGCARACPGVPGRKRSHYPPSAAYSSRAGAQDDVRMQGQTPSNYYYYYCYHYYYYFYYYYYHHHHHHYYYYYYY